MARTRKTKRKSKLRKQQRHHVKAAQLEGRREPALVHAQNTIRFTTENPVPVEDVIRSLEGMDVVVRQFLPRAIYELTGARVIAAELLVEGLEEGSLVEKTIVTLLFKDEKNFQRFLLKIREQGIDWFDKGTPVMKGAAISILLAALVLGGLAYLSKDEPQSGALANIQGDNNVVFVIGAEAYQTNPEAFERALDKAIPKTQQKALANASANFIAPSKRESGAAIEVQANGQTIPVISSDTVASAPASIGIDDSTHDQRFGKATLNVRATDLDSTRKGWAATIDGLVDKRTRVVFAHEPDMLKVVHKPKFDAEVTVTYGPGLKPLLITIEKVL